MLENVKNFFSEQLDLEIEKREKYNSSIEVESFKKYFQSIPFDYKIQFIRELAKFMSAKKSVDLLKSVKGISNPNLTPLIKNYFQIVSQAAETTEKTIYITDVNRADRFSSLCNQYTSIREFKQGDNHKGYYLKEFDIAFIYQGNHSINLAYMFGKVKLTTNEYFQNVEIDKSFLDIEINSVIDNNIFIPYIGSYNKDMTLIWIAIQEYLKEKILRLNSAIAQLEAGQGKTRDLIEDEVYIMNNKKSLSKDAYDEFLEIESVVKEN